MTTKVLSGARVPLRKGVVYRARVRVDAMPWMASKSSIAAKFEDEGFSSVVVYKEARELPTDWPDDQRAIVAGAFQFTAFLEGTWGLADETRTRPEPVLALWVHALPLAEGGGTLDGPPQGSHAWARQIIVQAWASLFGRAPDAATAQAVQAIALHEGGYGLALLTPEGAPSNNWGAVQCSSGWSKVACDKPQTCPAGCFVHKDTDAKGVCYLACFRLYATPLAGATDFITTLVRLKNRAGVLDAIGAGNATVIAREMRKSRYFEASEASYTAAIERRATEIAKALGEPVMVRASSWVAGLASLGAVAGVTFLWYRSRVNT